MTPPGDHEKVTTGAYIRNLLDGKQFLITTDDAIAIMADERGAYEQRIGEDGRTLYSGECAAGDGRVEEGEPFLIAYHDTLPGGIFHQRCDPRRPDPSGWYGLDPRGADQILAAPVRAGG